MNKQRMRTLEMVFQEFLGMSQGEIKEDLSRYNDDPIVDLLLEVNAVELVYKRSKASEAFRSYLRNRNLTEHKKRLFTEFESNMVCPERSNVLEGLTVEKKRPALRGSRKIEEISYSDDYPYNVAA